MTAKELKRIFQKGECLSLDTMRLYNDGKLNKKSMHEVEKHLLECGLCAGAVDGLNQKRLNEVNKLTEHIQRRLAVYMNTPPRVPFFRRFGFAIITGLILLVGSCSWWLFSQNKKGNVTKISDKVVSNQLNPVISESPVVVNAEPVSLQPENSSPIVSGNSPYNNDNKTPMASSKMQNLPADLPGKPNTFTVGQPQNQADNGTANPDKPDDGIGANSKSANSNSFLRIKNVNVYPPVTLNDKSTRKASKDGQLGRTGTSDASFELDQMPSYPGGDEALKNFIMANFKPTAADRAKLTRYATGVMFVVNAKTGAISSPELSFSISREVDAELLRVISTMPNWNPGKKRGEVQVMIGITFE
jgi:hypothetical protein